MSALPKPDPQDDLARLDVAVDQAIAACDGDVRAAIRALVMANEFLEMELSEVYASVSRGYTRGEVWRDPPTKEDTSNKHDDTDLDNIADWYD